MPLEVFSIVKRSVGVSPGNTVDCKNLRPKVGSCAFAGVAAVTTKAQAVETSKTHQSRRREYPPPPPISECTRLIIDMLRHYSASVIGIKLAALRTGVSTICNMRNENFVPASPSK